MGVFFAQERINEFVVNVDENHNPMTFYSSYGATPNDGVVIVNSTIPDLEFGILSVDSTRLRKVVPDKRKSRYVLIIQPNDINYQQYTITINAKGFMQGKINDVEVKAGLSSGFIVNPKYTNNATSSIINKDHDYVDLGLPSGTLWATCNVGANSPEEYGDYFAWGEPQTKATYIWSTYKWCNGNYNKLTKYCNESYYGDKGITDDLSNLEDCDDPVTVNWGRGWCSPTVDQWHELMLNTTNKWSALNGVPGRLFTAKNGQTLFLPAAGYYYETVKGLWVEKICSTYHLYFGSDYCNVGFTNKGRCHGNTVRPVRSSRK